jgi:TorA maturation chaperone TorD
MGKTIANDELLCRAAVYRLLARLWKHELDAETLDELLHGAMRESYIAAGGSLPQSVDQETLDALALDFCQLFLGPTGHLPPYQSVWDNGQFHGSSTESLRGYLELLSTDEWNREEMPDHFSLELEVMAHLLEQLDQICPESPDFDSLTQLVSAFFHDHLAWVEKLCTVAASRAQTDFYRNMIRVTTEFLDQETTTSFAIPQEHLNAS